MASPAFISLRAVLAAQASVADAQAMMAYMKDHFDFFGIRSADRKALAAPHIKSWLSLGRIDMGLVWELWEAPEREFQYIAMDYLSRCKRYWEPAHMQDWERLVCNRAWWDTVDFIASTLVGGLIKKHPELALDMDAWNASEDMWKQRTAMLYQLKYKDAVDTERLGRYIQTHAASKEFFLQKAAGWALRQYSKSNPNWVSNFIASNRLSNLTLREGGKYLEKPIN